jgi:hypothetical protein
VLLNNRNICYRLLYEHRANYSFGTILRVLTALARASFGGTVDSRARNPRIGKFSYAIIGRPSGDHTVSYATALPIVTAAAVPQGSFELELEAKCCLRGPSQIGLPVLRVSRRYSMGKVCRRVGDTQKP